MVARGWGGIGRPLEGRACSLDFPDELGGAGWKLELRDVPDLADGHPARVRWGTMGSPTVRPLLYQLS
jgi:hypothetical protein